MVPSVIRDRTTGGCEYTVFKQIDVGGAFVDSRMGLQVSWVPGPTFPVTAFIRS